jgi:hypothetical protein
MYGDLVTEENYMLNYHYQRKKYFGMLLPDLGWIMQSTKDKAPVNKSGY